MHSLRLLLTSRARSLGGAGDLSNDDFLLDYGFLPPYPNTHDTCDLAWADGGLLSSARGAAGMDDSLAEWQRSALRLHIPQGYQAVSIHRAGVDERAMAACRIAAAPDAASSDEEPPPTGAPEGAPTSETGDAPPPTKPDGNELRMNAALCLIALTKSNKVSQEAAKKVGAVEAVATLLDGDHEWQGAYLAAMAMQVRSPPYLHVCMNTFHDLL